MARLIILHDKKILIKRLSAIIYIQTYIIIFMSVMSIILLIFILILLPLKEMRPWLITLHNDRILIQEVGDNDQILERELVNIFVRTIEIIDKRDGIAKEQIVQQYATPKLIDLIKTNDDMKTVKYRVANEITRDIKINETQKVNNIYEVQWDGIDTNINDGMKQTHRNLSKISLVKGKKLCQNPLNTCINSYHSTRI